MTLSLTVVVLSQTSNLLPIARASSDFNEEFNGSSMPVNWLTYSMHGAYTVDNGVVNLRSADYTPWASISIQSVCFPGDNGFTVRARVRNNGGYGVYIALFLSNQSFIVSKNGEENSQCTRNTIAICNDYDAFRVCRGTSPTANHWNWFNIAGAGTVGNWYVLELVVNKSPYKITASVYDNNNVLIGSGSITDMILPYSQISVCGVGVWRGVPSSDSLANYDVDWVRSENLSSYPPPITPAPEFPISTLFVASAIFLIFGVARRRYSI